MEDVFDVLADEHEEIRQVLAELEKGPVAATGATEDQLMLRKIMTEELIIEQSKRGITRCRSSRAAGSTRSAGSPPGAVTTWPRGSAR